MGDATDSPRRAPDSRLRNRSRVATFLCYHSIAPQGPRYLTVSAELFERQLDALQRRGLRPGDLGTLSNLAAGAEVGSTAFLTFDDGFHDNYATALPIVRSYRFRAFIFVLPPRVDDGGALNWPEVADHQRQFPSLMRSVTWSMLGEMVEAGFEVGSHTLTHAHLGDLDGEQLREELSESRIRIREQLGRCDVLAYPFGEWTPRVEAAAADCGYSFAFTLPTTHGQGPATPLSIPRINVDYRDDGRRFAVKLTATGKRIVLSPGVRAIQRLAGRRRGGPDQSQR